MTAKRNTLEGDRLDVLITLVEARERKTYLLDFPDPVDAIKYHMDQNGLHPGDLIPFIGSRTRGWAFRRSRSSSLDRAWQPDEPTRSASQLEIAGTEFIAENGGWAGNDIAESRRSGTPRPIVDQGWCAHCDDQSLFSKRMPDLRLIIVLDSCGRHASVAPLREPSAHVDAGQGDAAHVEAGQGDALIRAWSKRCRAGLFSTLPPFSWAPSGL
jgi:hypothetical protein